MIGGMRGRHRRSLLKIVGPEPANLANPKATPLSLSMSKNIANLKLAGFLKIVPATLKQWNF